MNRQRLPKNVSDAIIDYLDGTGEPAIETSIDVRIYPSQKAFFHEMWVDVNGELTVQFDVILLWGVCEVSSTNLDGEIVKYKTL